MPNFATILKRCLFLAALPMVCFSAAQLSAREPELVAAVQVDWGDEDFIDLSGAGFYKRFMVVCNNESLSAAHVLEERSGKYHYLGQIPLIAQPSDQELDLEGISCVGNRVYVVGSHSRDSKNQRQRAREHVFQFELNEDGKLAGEVKSISLREVIKKHEVFDEATRLPPKEGGVDIEGIAFHDGWLYAGFRGPLDNSEAIVAKFKFEDPNGTAELMSLDLGGLAIRDIAQVGDDFWILAGPLDGSPRPFQIHSWNGKHGSDCKLKRLCTIPVKGNAKAEGLAMLDTNGDTYEFLILHDGPVGGSPLRYKLKLND